MDLFKYFMESSASVISLVYNSTLSLASMLSLHKYNLLCHSLPYIVALLATIVGLLIYYYLWLPTNSVQDYSDTGYQYLNGETHRRTTKLERIKELQQRRQLGDCPPVYPNGWFALLESVDIKGGQVKHVQALGENFAVMRTTTGEVHVLDAYCPHLGANMAVGGVVRGDCLECPFHGWQFRGEDGVCSHIPYSDKAPKTAVLKRWTSTEVNGFVFVWYHAEGEPSSWQMESIPEIESGKLWYCGRVEMYISAHIQDIMENISDIPHFGIIHTVSAFAGSDLCTYDRFIHRFLKHSWNLSWEQHSEPGEEHMCTLSIVSSVQLFKNLINLPTIATTTEIGPGSMVGKHNGCRNLITFIPVEPMVSRLVIRCYTPPHIYIFGGLILYIQRIMLERDIMLWNQKKHVAKPQLVKEDETIRRFRRWYSQFYSANSPRLAFQQDSKEW